MTVILSLLGTVLLVMILLPSFVFPPISITQFDAIPNTQLKYTMLRGVPVSLVRITASNAILMVQETVTHLNVF